MLYGSVISLLINEIMTGSPENNLSQLWLFILHKYNQLNIKNRYGSLTLTMFSTKTGIKLKGKAAEVRDIGPVLHAAWLAFCPGKLELHRVIELCLRLGNHMETILNDTKTLFVVPSLQGMSSLTFNIAMYGVCMSMTMYMSS